MLFALRLAALLDHLPAAVAPTAFADTMRAHQLAALRAHHQSGRIQALVLAAIATAVARNFRLWYGAHYKILNPFLISNNRIRLTLSAYLPSAEPYFTILLCFILHSKSAK